VKILRRILIGVVLTVVLAGLLVGLAFVPAVQTWYAQSKLDAREDVHGTVGSLSAGLHQVELADLHLEIGAVVIDVPSLQANLPVTSAAWKHDVRIGSLVAKGWTIDLSRTLEPEKTPAQPGSTAEPTKTAGTAATATSTTTVPAETPEVQQALKILRSIVGGQALPCDLSLDGVELEGDVIVSSPQSGSVRVHVTVKGGGVAAGREGDLVIAADAVSPWPGVREATLQGHLLVAQKSPRRIDRIALTSDLAIGREAPAEDINLALGLEIARGAGEALYRANVSQGGRRLVGFVAHCPEAGRQISGDWTVDVRNSDLALLMPDHAWPVFAATAAGRFESDGAFAAVRVNGKLGAGVNQLEVLAPALERLGGVALTAHFNLERRGHGLHFTDLGATMTKGVTSVSLQSLQAFDLDEQTGTLALADSNGDWLEGSTRNIPLDWFSDPNGALAVAGGNVTGEFLVRSTSGGLVLRPKQTWAVKGIAVQRSGRPLVRNLDLSLAWLADYDAAGWHMQWAPLTVSHSGRRLATVEAKFTRPPGANQGVAVSGTWQADLEAVAALPEFSAAGKLAGHSASGEFTANLAELSQVDAKVTVLGHDPAQVFSASVTAAEENVGKWSFQIPFKMSLGSQVTDLTAEGSWMSTPSRGRSYVRVTGDKLAVEQLRPLAVPLAALGGVAWPAKLLTATAADDASALGRDAAPFWGDVEGTLVFEVEQVNVGDRVYRNVGGSLEFGAREVRLEHVRGLRAQTLDDPTVRMAREPAQLEGRITFDAAAELPYALQATADLGEIDVASVLPPLKSGHDPLLEGHFTVTGGLGGSGANLADLASRVRQEFKLTSKAGISRLLKIYIGDVFQDEETSTLSDTVGGVGSLVGKLFALKSEPREKKVSKTVENVLDLSSQLAEIEYESCTLTVVRSPDGAIRLAALEVVAPDTRLTGTGEIAGGKGPAYFAQPLKLDLTVGARGHTAEMFGKAGLLSAKKDGQGYSNLNQTLHFGGSLEHLDQTMWHDLLIKAMNLPPSKKPAGDGATVNGRH